jgi:hypothetical protein
LNKILVIGEVLVEIVALEKGYGFRSPMNLVGPFPSGAPPIFIDPAAKRFCRKQVANRPPALGSVIFCPVSLQTVSW